LLSPPSPRSVLLHYILLIIVHARVNVKHIS
jgi:hypothetical protein